MLQLLNSLPLQVIQLCFVTPRVVILLLFSASLPTNLEPMCYQITQD